MSHVFLKGQTPSQYFLFLTICMRVESGDERGETEKRRDDRSSDEFRGRKKRKVKF